MPRVCSIITWQLIVILLVEHVQEFDQQIIVMDQLDLHEVAEALGAEFINTYINEFEHHHSSLLESSGAIARDQGAGYIWCYLSEIFNGPGW